MAKFPPIHAYDAVKADAFADPIQKGLYQLSLTVLPEALHEYRVSEETLRQLAHQIAIALNES